MGLLLILINIPERFPKDPFLATLRRSMNALDLVGFAIFAPFTAMLFLALDYGGNQFAWNSPTVIGLLCGAVGNLIIFLIWEYRMGDDAMIPFSMMRQRIIWSSSLTMFFFCGVLFIGSYYLPIYFQSTKDASPLMSGVYLLPTILMQGLMSFGGGGAGK